MASENTGPREVMVQFKAHYLSYNSGDRAYFYQDEADHLVALGVADNPEIIEPPDPPPEKAASTPKPHRHRKEET